MAKENGNVSLSKDLSSGKAHHSRPFGGVVLYVEKAGEEQRRMAEEILITLY